MDTILKNISKGRKRAIRSKSDLEPLMDFKQNHYETGNVTKAAIKAAKFSSPKL